MAGVESQGMIMCAVHEENVELLHPGVYNDELIGKWIGIEGEEEVK